MTHAGERYSGEFTGDFDLTSQELTGQSGEWSLSVTRLGSTDLGLPGYDGKYAFTMTC